MKKGELVKQERHELITIYAEEPSRVTFKKLATYSSDFPHLQELVLIDEKNTNFMICRICEDKKDIRQAFILAKPNNRYGS